MEQLRAERRRLFTPASSSPSSVAPAVEEAPHENGEAGTRSVPSLGRILSQLGDGLLPECVEKTSRHLSRFAGKDPETFVDQVERALADREELTASLKAFFDVLNRLDLSRYPWFNRSVIFQPEFLANAAFLGYFLRGGFIRQEDLTEQLFPLANTFAGSHPRLESSQLLEHFFGSRFSPVQQVSPFSPEFTLFMLGMLSDQKGVEHVIDFPRVGKTGKMPDAIVTARRGRILHEFKTLVMPSYVFLYNEAKRQEWLRSRLTGPDNRAQGVRARLTEAAEQIKAEQRRTTGRYLPGGEIDLGIQIPREGEVNFEALHRVIELSAEALRAEHPNMIVNSYFFREGDTEPIWTNKPLQQN